MARVAPFCHACAWMHGKAIGRAAAKALVRGVIEQKGKWMVYERTVDLCAMHDYLFDVDKGLEPALSTYAALEAVKNR